MEQLRDSLTDHVNDELLEGYALANLSEPDVSYIEEHLLVCAPCRQRLVEADQFVALIRNAFQHVNEEPVDRARTASGGSRS